MSAEAQSTDAVYVDTSLLASALAPDDSNHSRARAWLADNRFLLVTSAISEVELRRALARRNAPSALKEAAGALLRTCEMVDVTDEIRSQACEVLPTSTKTLDAIHVATAMVCELNDFATFDLRQQVAAEEAGLTVAQPRAPRT